MLNTSSTRKIRPMTRRMSKRVSMGERNLQQGSGSAMKGTKGLPRQVLGSCRLRRNAARISVLPLSHEFLQLAFLKLHGMSLPHDLAGVIHQQRMRDARDAKVRAVLAGGIESHVIVDGHVLRECLHCRDIFIRDSHSLQAFRLVLLVEFIEVRNALPAGRAPGGPELDDERLACERRVLA